MHACIHTHTHDRFSLEAIANVTFFQRPPKSDTNATKRTQLTNATKLEQYRKMKQTDATAQINATAHSPTRAPGSPRPGKNHGKKTKKEAGKREDLIQTKKDKESAAEGERGRDESASVGESGDLGDVEGKNDEKYEEKEPEVEERKDSRGDLGKSAVKVSSERDRTKKKGAKQDAKTVKGAG